MTFQSWGSWVTRPAVQVCLAVFSLLALAASVWLVPRMLAMLPPDYLRSGRLVGEQGAVARFLRNVVGLVLVLLGLAMLVLPGQGLLTLLAGMLLLDFPGKHRLLVRMLSQPAILRGVNKLRAHRGCPPLLT